MDQPRRLVKPVALVALLALLALVGCDGPFPQSTLSPVSELGSDQDALFRLIFWWAVIVFVFVEGGIVYVLIKFRARAGGADPEPVHGHTALEIAWTLAPALIIVFIAVPSIQLIWKDAGADTSDALQVQAIGHQWWWEFRYPELGIVTANDLHLPQGRTVELQLTSADVIHSFWLPRMSGKRDMILGHNTRLVFVPDSLGEFPGQCAEYCGSSHANMRFRAFVHDSAAFAAWVAAEAAPPVAVETMAATAQQGLQVFRTKGCIACHTVRGIAPGVLGPNLDHVGSRSRIAGGLLENTPENLAAWLRDPAGVKPGSLMPTIPLTEDEIAALAAYLGSLR